MPHRAVGDLTSNDTPTQTRELEGVSEMSRRAIESPNLPTASAARFGYSLAVQTGNIIWIAGQIARGNGELVGIGDVEAQAVQVYENLKEILRAAGTDFSSVVSTTTYFTDRAHLHPINDVRRRYLMGDVLPTSTDVIVAGLAGPDFLLEVSAIAVIDD